MNILDLFKKKEKTSIKTEKCSDSKLTKEQIDEIIDYLRLNYSKDAFMITIDEAAELSLTDSKFGGYPYWDLEKEYPKSSAGEALYLLAQINFEQAEIDSVLFPSKGILQFFILPEDLYGMDIEDGSRQDRFRVIYHPQIRKDISLTKLKTAGIRANTDLDERSDSFPFFREYSLSMKKSIDTINPCVENFDQAFMEALNALYGHGNEEIRSSGQSVYQSLGREHFAYISDTLSGWGHKLLGYPGFTQNDPRVTKQYSEKRTFPELAQFNTLLLQIDSEKDIMWGDCGICNFFINGHDLKNLDFSNVLYNWDCH